MVDLGLALFAAPVFALEVSVLLGACLPGALPAISAALAVQTAALVSALVVLRMVVGMLKIVLDYYCLT
jgi:hypothetical protein